MPWLLLTAIYVYRKCDDKGTEYAREFALLFKKKVHVCAYPHVHATPVCVAGIWLCVMDTTVVVTVVLELQDYKYRHPAEAATCQTEYSESADCSVSSCTSCWPL